MTWEKAHTVLHRLTTHSPRSPGICQDVDRKGPQELAGRLDSEREKDHEGRGGAFFCRAAGCEVGDASQQESSGPAAKPRGQKPSTAKAARAQAGSSFKLNQT